MRHQARVYRCKAGHALTMPTGGTFTALEVNFGDGPVGYNYCQHCFGTWAVQQFPLVEQTEQTKENPDGVGG